MDIDTMRIFLEVYQRGSFAAVARERNVAPSSISRAVSQLEESLGVRLFQRTTRKLSATEAGALYFERLEPLLEELELAGQLTRDVSLVPRGTLRITAPQTFARQKLVPLLPELAARYPELRFELLLNDALYDLVDQRIDVAIRLGALPDSTMVAQPLMPMRYACCASPGYLQRRGLIERPEQLSAHDCLRYPVPGYGARWLFRKDNTALEVPVQGRFLITDAVALKDCAVAGLGVVMLPRWNVEQELSRGELVALLPDWECTASRFDLRAWALYPSRDYVPRKVRVFVEFLRARLG